MLVIRRLSSGPSAMLKTTMLLLALLGAAAAGAQPPDVSASPERAKATVPAPKTPAASDQPAFHDLICKPNGSEDEFDCHDEATPAKMVPIPSQSLGPREQDVAVSG
jgi:hypothetical protein